MIAIVHYHLQPGGVTQVVLATSRLLAENGIPHVILTGDAGNVPANDDFPISEIPGLGYLPQPGTLTAASLADALRDAAFSALGGPPELWHFHNHSLGKNVLFPELVARLAAAGERLLLQIHDLAENGRPENHRLLGGNPRLYPFGPRVRTAFLNRRDLEIFTRAGLPPDCARLLPNPLSVPVLPQTPAPPNPILFAPIRGIRRKNLGELVLLAALAPTGAAIAISRAPRNPAARPIHDTWRDFASRHHLPIAFDATDRYQPAPDACADFKSWLARASHIVTTSVSEGFGLPFAEAAALGKPLLGRRLAHLPHCRGPWLYDRISIPVDWVDLPILRTELATTLERNFRQYRRPLPQQFVRETLDSLVRDHTVDFGNLPEPLQQGVIERLAHPAERAVPLVETAGKSQPLETWLAAAIADRTPPPVLLPDEFPAALLGLYRELRAAPAGPVRHVPPEAILAAHLVPDSFHFLLSALAPAAPERRFRAVVFDIYGTLLDAPPGGVKPDPATDPALRGIVASFGHAAPDSPSAALHAAVVRHHAAADAEFPEIDLRELWREILDLPEDADTTSLVTATEAAWHPATPMPGAADFVRRLSRAGLSLGLLSNAQSNTLPALGPLAELFPPELVILSYRHRIAKPSAGLFQIMADRLAAHGIAPAETLFVGNDPAQDIAPARAAGFRTALFGEDSAGCEPDIIFQSWQQLARWMERKKV